MSRVYLVARREYAEILKTKTFWIGILSLPLFYVIAFALMFWFQEKAEVRRYAVIDESGWLLPEIESRLGRPSLHKVAGALVKEDPALPSFLATSLLARNLGAAAESGRLNELVRGLDRLAALAADQLAMLDDARPFLERAFPGVTPEMIRELRADVDRLRDWWVDLPSGDASRDRFAPSAREKKFELVRVDADEAGLAKMLESGELFAYFVIGEDPVEGSEGCKYVSSNQAEFELSRSFSRVATRIVRERRVEQLELEPKDADWIEERLAFSQSKITETGEEAAVSKADIALEFAPAVFVILLWIAVLVTSQILLTNMIEEKSNRTIEVLLSSVSPLELMAGKILGIAASGFSIVGFWVLFAWAGIELAPIVFPNAADVLAELGLGAVLTNGRYLGSFLGYFITGYLLYAIVFAGIGSVFNSLKEAQGLMQPVVMVMLVPYLAAFQIVRSPNGTLAQVLTWIPPFTPFIMMARAGGPPTLTEYVGTSALMLVCLVVGFWGAAKIFRVGILMTGKPMRLFAILRLLRAPIGRVPDRSN